MVTIKTNFGDISIELFEKEAPITTANFLEYVRSGFYKDTLFHRVINGFMIQGGGFDEAFEQKEAESIKGEFMANGFMSNDLKHTRGVLSMARTMAPNSASSQFFIMHRDAPHLDGQYAGFGKVIEGIEVVDKIANVQTCSRGWYDDVPRVPVVIEKVEIVE